MPEFEMNGKSAPAFVALDSFAQGFIEAMFFTSCCASTYTKANWSRKATQRAVAEGQADGCLPNDAGAGDLHPDTLKTIVAFCDAFKAAAAPVLAEAYARDYSEEQAGRDLWYTSQGHGVGYWDREELEALPSNPDEYERLRLVMVAKGTSPDEWAAAHDARAKLCGESVGDKLSELAGRHEFNPSFYRGKVYL